MEKPNILIILNYQKKKNKKFFYALVVYVYFICVQFITLCGCLRL